MWGKSYRAGRHMGHMSLDNRQRMTNRAEVGFGTVGMFTLIILFLIIIGVFL